MQLLYEHLTVLIMIMIMIIIMITMLQRLAIHDASLDSSLLLRPTCCRCLPLHKVIYIFSIQGSTKSSLSFTSGLSVFKGLKKVFFSDMERESYFGFVGISLISILFFS